MKYAHISSVAIAQLVSVLHLDATIAGSNTLGVNFLKTKLYKRNIVNDIPIAHLGHITGSSQAR